MAIFNTANKERDVVHVSSKHEIKKVEGGYEVNCPNGPRFIPQENCIVICEVMRVFKGPGEPLHAGEIVETVEGLGRIPKLPLVFKHWNFAFLELWFEVESLGAE